MSDISLSSGYIQYKIFIGTINGKINHTFILINWVCIQTESIQREVAESTEVINTSKSELTDLKRTLQALEIELQSQLSMVSVTSLIFFLSL